MTKIAFQQTFIRVNLYLHASRLLAALSLAVALLPAGLRAQDIHFSQFANSPLNLSPALAGVFGGDLRFVGNFRSQWRSVPVPYTTYSASAENKFYFKRENYRSFLTGSLLINYDKQGSLDLTSLHIGIPISVTMPVSTNKFFTLGVTPAFGQRSVSSNKITTDQQWDDCMFNPNIFHGENQLGSGANLKYFDVTAGANFRIQSRQKRSRLDLGAAMHHINRPSHDFWSSGLESPGETRLYNKNTFYGQGLLQIADNVDILAQALFQRQGGYKENVVGGSLRFHLNRNSYKELAVQVGANWRYRYTNALIPQIEVLYRTWSLGFTYDVDIFNSDIITSRRGGPEVSLIYRLYKMKNLAKFNSCILI